MRALLTALLLCAAVPAAAEPPLELAGYISSWTQDCQGASCSLPVPGERNRPLDLRLAPPAEPGQAAVARASETLVLGEHGEIKAELAFYAICPYGGVPGSCAGRYFQVQAVLSGPAGAFCSAALNIEDFLPFPVLTCAGAVPGRRFGITLHRKAL